MRPMSGKVSTCHPPLNSAGNAGLSNALFRRPWIIAVLLGVAVFLNFLPALFGDFVNWDDAEHVFENRTVLDGLSPAGVRGAFTEVVVCCWAPLTVLSYQCDSTLFGTGPAGYHLTNVLLHACAAATLALALGRMTAAPGLSAAAVLLFAIHPLRVESVAWISERKDVLSVLLLGVTLLAYERYCRAPSIAWYVGVVIALLAGLMAKATLVTVPVLLLLLDCWPLCRLAVPGLGDAALREAAARRYPPRPWQAVLAEKLPLLLLSVIFIGVTLHTQKTAIRSPTALPLLSARLPNAVHATAWYVWTTVWPTGLHAFYGHPGRVGWPPVVLASAVATLTFLVAAAVRLRSSVPAVAVGLVWFAVALSPVIGIVAQQGSQAQADRYSYVPHIGLMISVVWAAAAAAARLRVPTLTSMIVLMLVSAVFVAIDQRLIPTWKNSTGLWSRVLTIEPGNARARYHYGGGLYDRGEVSAAIGEFQTALATLQAAANTSESQSEVCTALGVALLGQGKTPEAVEQFHRAITLDPTNHAARMEFGLMLFKSGRPREAAESFAKVLTAQPTNVDAARNLVIAEARAGDLPAATAACRRLVALLPGKADSHSRMGQLLLQGGSSDQAIEEFRVAAQLDPGHPGIFSLLSRAYAAAGRPEEAEQAAARDRLQVRDQPPIHRQGH